MAECSESTGRIRRLFRSARAKTRGAAMTMVSLLARARSEPASRAAREGASPAAPAIPFTVMSAPASATARSSSRGP